MRDGAKGPEDALSRHLAALDGLRLEACARRKGILAQCSVHKETADLEGLAWKTHKRAAFYIAAPTHLVAGDAFFSRLQERVTSCLGAAAASTVFLPSIIECNGKWTLEAVNMDIKRSQAVLRSLLFTLGFENEAPAVTTYSLRRFLPTIGETLQLTEAERSSLGNWVGGVTM